MSLDSLDSRLAAVAESLRPRPELLAELSRFVRESRDLDLFRVNVVAWADDRGLPRDDVLDLFLHASRAGIFDLTWGVICPICGVFVATTGALRYLQRNAQCQFCQRPVELSLDEAVEAAFTISPAVRAIELPRLESVDELREGYLGRFYTRSLVPDAVHERLAAGLRAFALVGPGESGELRFDAVEGGHTIAAPELHTVVHVPARPGGELVQTIELLDGQLAGVAPLGVGPAVLTVRNRSTVAAYVGVAYTQSVREIDFGKRRLELRPNLSAKRLLTSQTFRELYRGEGVGAEGGLQIRNLAILFTDLTASTELYERVGDLKALELVRRHFDVLRDVIAAERGAVVKTIGDAVMATFGEPDRALAAAARMHAGMTGIAGDGADLVLKIGVHAGPCVAVESNQQLDYFGRTVNVAARVQAKADAGEVVVTDELLSFAGVKELVRERFPEASADRVQLKGIAGDVLVHRLRTAG